MAQTGFTPIQLYSSSTTGNTPAAADLLNSSGGSELAINIFDGKLFYKDNAGAVQVIGWKIVPVSAGGTGQTSYTDGQLLIGNSTGNTLTKATLTAGTGISITNGAGAITINATGGTGTVTSVSGTGTVSGISLSGTVTSSGSLTLGGTLDLSSPPTIGNTTANTIAGTTITASTKFAGTYYDASSSAGGNLRTSGGTACFQWGAGGGNNCTVDGSINMNGANAHIDMSPTGTGHVSINPTGVGDINNVIIGATTPLAITGTTITATTFSGSGASLTSIPNSALVNSTISGVALGGSLFNLTAGTGVTFSTGTTYNGSTAITINATGTGGTVTSVAALTLGTTGTDLSSTVANGTTTPVITLNVPTASATNRGALSAADWTTFNNKQPAGTYVTNLTGPITSVGNATSIASQTGTGTKFVVDNTPTLITPVLGVATATSVNKMAITAPATSSTLAVADGKTLTASNTLTLAGTDSTTLTFPTTSATIARTDAAQTFTGIQTFTDNVVIATSGKGIDFSATPGTGTSELFSDYEEGTFTPTVVGTTTAGTGTYTSQVGRYTKIGNRVYFNINLDWSAHTGTGNIQVNGLPFTSNATANAVNTVSSYNNNYAITALNIMQCFVSTSATSVTIRQIPVGGGSVATVALDTAAQILLAGHYEV
jgi:hypothetical protein